MQRSEARLIASALALAAFAVAVVAGLAADVPTGTILTRAIVAMAAANLFGWLIGVVVERIVAEHAARYESANTVGGASSPVVSAVAGEPNSGRTVDEKK